MEINRELLKRMRQKKGLTQKDMADLLECTTTNYQQWENGKRNPKLENVERLAAVLNIPVRYLTDTQYSDLEVERPPRLTGNHFPQPPAFRITDIMVTLNETGQGKVIDYASDLSKIPEYQAAAAPDPEGCEPPETEKDPRNEPRASSS